MRKEKKIGKNIFQFIQLLKKPDSKLAKDYLKERNLTAEVVKKFNIGYVKKNPNFYETLIKKFDEIKFLEEIPTYQNFSFAATPKTNPNTVPKLIHIAKLSVRTPIKVPIKIPQHSPTPI